MKNKILLFIALFFLTSCGALSDAGKVLRNEKKDTTDEFLVKKREPLVLPPDYDKIPAPNSKSDKDIQNSNENKIKKILENKEDKNSVGKKSSSTEESILKQIKK